MPTSPHSSGQYRTIETAASDLLPLFFCFCTQGQPVISPAFSHEHAGIVETKSTPPAHSENPNPTKPTESAQKKGVTASKPEAAQAFRWTHRQTGRSPRDSLVQPRSRLQPLLRTLSQTPRAFCYSYHHHSSRTLDRQLSSHVPSILVSFQRIPVERQGG